jgi:hypothetical protein
MPEIVLGDSDMAKSIEENSYTISTTVAEGNFQGSQQSL